MRAGRLFDAKTGTMLSNQIVLIRRDRITDVGPSVQIPSDARISALIPYRRGLLPAVRSLVDFLAAEIPKVTEFTRE